MRQWYHASQVSLSHKLSPIQDNRGGGPAPPLKAPESAAGMLRVIKSLEKDQNGKFLDYNGKEMSW